MTHYEHMVFIHDGLELETDKRPRDITTREQEQCKFQCLQLIKHFLRCDKC